MATVNPGKIVHPLGLAISLALAGDLTLFALLPIFRVEAGLTLGAVGVMFGVNRLVRVIGNPFAGGLVRHTNKHKFLLIGYSLAVVCTFGYAAAYGFWLFMILRIAWGCAWVLIYLGSMSYIFDVTTMHNRGKYSGVFMTWFMIGLAAGSLFGGSMADILGYHKTMWVCGYLALFAWLVIAIMIPKEINPLKSPPAKTIKSTLIAAVNSYRHLLKKSPKIKPVLLFYSITQFANDGIALGTMSLLFMERFPEGITTGSISIGLASISGISIAFRYIISSIVSPVFGSFSDGKIGRTPIVMLSLFLGSVGFIMLAYAMTIEWLVFALFINAMSVGAALPSLAGLLGDTSPKENDAQALGLYASAGDLGGAIGSFFCYGLLIYIGLNWVYLLTSAGFLIILLFGFNLLRKPVIMHNIVQSK
ncbi:MAG: MFS transporter [Chloroflexi bacterium]|nr:MFS transporter [Chloroflexota bacterium]